VVLAYGVIQGILHTFARRPRQVEESAPALVISEATVQE